MEGPTYENIIIILTFLYPVIHQLMVLIRLVTKTVIQNIRYIYIRDYLIPSARLNRKHLVNTIELETITYK